MKYQKGDVILVDYPYTDLVASKVRPAVVVSSELYQNERPDLLMAALTSNVTSATGTLDYVLQDWRLAGLRFMTAFKPLIAAIEPSLVVHKIGTLTRVDIDEIDRRLKLAMNL